MSKILIIHHNDRDGIVSAAIITAALHREETATNEMEIEYSEQNYTKPLSAVIAPEEAKKYTRVYLVDYSLSTSKDISWAKDMIKHTCFIWIDHHATSINAETGNMILKNVSGIRVDGISAAALCWMYTHKPISDLTVLKTHYKSHIDKVDALTFLSNRSVPRLIRLVHQYDIWDHSKVDMYPIYFNYGNQHDLEWWIELLENHTTSYLDTVAVDSIDTGKAKYPEIVERNEQFCKDYGFETTLRVDGKNYSVFAVNRGSGNSLLFGDIINKYDIVSVFSYVGSDCCYRYSIYSREDGVDVEQIAKYLGGGGHKHAAGFKSEECLYLSH